MREGEGSQPCVWQEVAPNVYLSDVEQAALDAKAAAEGLTRSEVLRALVDRELNLDDEGSEAVDAALADLATELAEQSPAAERGRRRPLQFGVIIVDDHLALLAIARTLPRLDRPGPIATTYSFHFRLARTVANSTRSGTLSAVRS